VSSFVSEFLHTAASGNCTELKTLYPNGNCHGVVLGYKSAHEVGSAQFGTGALADFTGTAPSGASRLTLLLVLSPSGKWQAIDSVPFGKKSVGTKPASVARFRNVATKSYTAVASRSCSSAYHYATASVPESEYCASFGSSPVTSVIAKNPNPTTVALGGTADVQFFGYFVKLPKSFAHLQHGDVKAYLTLAAVKAPAGVHASLPYLAEPAWPGPPPA
jgi:hypothetical protein